MTRRFVLLILSLLLTAGTARADSDYRRTVEEGTAWLERNGNSAEAAGWRVKVFRAWLDEAIVARRSAGLAAAVYLRYYEQLEMDSDLSGIQQDRLGFYAGISELVLGRTAPAGKRLGASGDARAAAWKQAAAGPPSGSGLEAVFARFALFGEMPDKAPAGGDDERSRIMADLLAWAADPEGGHAFSADRLRGEVETLGDTRIRFFDPALVLGYSRVCQLEARRALPPEKDLTKFRRLFWGELAYLDGNFAEARKAWAGIPGGKADPLATMADARAGGGSPKAALEAALAGDAPWVTETMVLMLALDGFSGWSAVAPGLSRGADAIRQDFLDRGGERVSERNVRGINWSAAVALWRMGDAEGARQRLDGVYNLISLGNLAQNPPQWLPEVVLGELSDMNSKTMLLRILGETAEKLPYLTPTYSALQVYFVHALEETEGEVR